MSAPAWHLSAVQARVSPFLTNVPGGHTVQTASLVVEHAEVVEALAGHVVQLCAAKHVKRRCTHTL